MRWLLLSPVVVVAAPVAIAWLRGHRWIALVPYGLFVGAFTTVVILGPDESSGHPLQLVWLGSLVLLEFSMVPRPLSDSWWALRYRSRNRPRLEPGLPIGVAMTLWLVPIGLVGFLGELLLMGAVGAFAVLGVVATLQMLFRGGRDWERMAFMAWAALLPMGAVVAALLGGHIVLGR